MSSKLDYLKKYMNPEPEKKKKKVRGVRPGTFKVVDEDIRVSSTKHSQASLTVGEAYDEKPTIVATYEELNPKHELPSGVWETASIPKRMSVPEDLSPKRLRHDSPSPPRARHDSPDLSPPRQRHTQADLSPPRQRHDSPDQSPPRRSRHISPPRKPLADRDLSPPRKTRSPPRQKMGDGTRSGLQSADQLKAELEAKKARETSRFNKASTADLGKDADTVYRDRRGKKLDGLTEMMRHQQGQKLQSDDDGMEWGKGMVQKQSQQVKLDDDAYEASKPLARYADDADLEAAQKAAIRWGDPMAGLVGSSGKKRKLSKAEKKAAKKAAKKGRKYEGRPVYKGAYPANRFGLAPGYRWDGVDRSNGFEKKYFQKLNERKFRAETEYISNAIEL